MKKEKDNKGLIIGIVILLSLCLIAVFYFMFKVTYIGNKPVNNEKEQTQTEIEDNDEFIFNELTKYELKDGEEKEVTVAGKTIMLKRTENPLAGYINDIKIDGTREFYITNKFIISCSAGQYGNQYKFYNTSGQEIQIKEEDIELSYANDNLRIEENNLLFDQVEKEFVTFDNYVISYCEPGASEEKKLNNNKEIIENNKNQDVVSTYKIIYINDKIEFQKFKSLLTLEEYLKEKKYDNYCITEKNSN